MKKLPLILVIIILFIIPFFWFKPGEINLGGDSSRLYFYDPINYLKTFPIYSVAPSQTGEEMISYFFIPFTLFLAALKTIFSSPSILINIFHSFMLVISFFAVYLIIKELLGQKKSDSNLEFVAIIGGFFYALTPVIGFNWDKALVTHNQVFLNPLIFLLLLKFVNTKNTIYILLTLLITFIFSPNFSFISAPPFFAFYPFALLYLFIYGKFIKKTRFQWKRIFLFATLFLLIHSFHLIPQIAVVLDRNSNAFQRVFSLGGASDALQYFSSVYPSIKLTNNLAALPQVAKPLFPLDFLLFTFPAIVIWGLLLSYRKNDFLRKKNFLLLSVFLLITLFFSTANITSLGLSFYKGFFYLPGFGMFRNFYGQFMYVFYFFYALVLGHGLFYVISSIEGKKRVILSASLIILLVVNGWPFIKGDMVNLPILQTKDIKVPFKMDKVFEETLQFVREDPIDGKYLVLPLTDFGYQLVAGTEGGAYIGPSMIGYLTGKKDFSGHPGFSVHSNTLLKMAKQEDFDGFVDLLSKFNIYRIFYNSDPSIYDTSFPEFPYDYVRNFLPENQRLYKSFIEKLDVRLKSKFSDSYFIYEVPKDQYLPHIYVAKNVFVSNRPSRDINLPNKHCCKDGRMVEYNVESLSTINIDSLPFRNVDNVFVDAKHESSFLSYLISRKPSGLPSPFVSKELSFPFYSLVVWKEESELAGVSNKTDKFIDLALFFAEKRANEIEKWQDDLQILGDVEKISSLEWIEPGLWDFRRFDEYNYWEISLLRYRKQIIDIINTINKPNNSKYSSITNKIFLRDKLVNDKNKIDNAIKGNKTRSLAEKIYLLGLSDEMFEEIRQRLGLSVGNATFISYTADIPMDSLYEVYVEKTQFGNVDESLVAVQINGQTLRAKDTQNDKDWVNFGEIFLSKQENAKLLFVQERISNFASPKGWQEIEEQAIEEQELGENTVTLYYVDELVLPSGLTQKFINWPASFFFVLSFDYHTYGKTFRVKLHEKNNKEPLQSRLLLDEGIRSKEWKRYERVIISGSDAVSSILQIVKTDSDFFERLQSRDQRAQIDIKNVSLVQIPHPRIVLRKINPLPSQQPDIPKLTFIKVNPTKYKVHVSGAKDPYVLVFLDAYNGKWKLFLPKGENPAKSARGFLSRVIGEVGERVIGILGKEKDKGFNEIVETYFNGEVREGVHRDTFLDSDTFETWGQDPIAEYRHIVVNSYANGWYITPQDSGGKTDYELVIEMTRQKLFYGSLVISFVGLGVLCFWFIYTLKRHGSS